MHSKIHPYIASFFLLTAIFLCLFPTLYAHGQTLAVRFNNENWDTLPHPQVAEFTVEADGRIVGFTQNGITFVQYNVPNTYGIRVQRFEIEDHYHYVVEGEIANSIGEMSILLSRAYEEISNV